MCSADRTAWPKDLGKMADENVWCFTDGVSQAGMTVPSVGTANVALGLQFFAESSTNHNFYI
jgi:hypothetical protein